MYDRAWLGGPERSLEVILTNIGRPLTGLSGFLLLVVLEYWDLEGRAYRAAWEFMTQGQDLKELWVDFAHFKEPTVNS